MIKNNLKSFSISLIIFLSFIFSGGTVLAQASGSRLGTTTSTIGTPQQMDELNKNSNSLDLLAKRIGVYTMEETSKVLQEQSGAFSYLIAFLIFLELVSFVKSQNFSGVPALKELFDLIFAIAIVGSCVSTSVYRSTGLASVFGGGPNSGIFLSIDAIYKTKEFAENLTTAVLGSGGEIREKFEIARANLASVIFTGENTPEAAALAASPGGKIPPKTEELTCTISITSPSDYLGCLWNKYISFKFIVNILFFVVDILWLCALIIMSILFNLSAAMSLLMFTIIVPFGVIKEYRRRLWTAFKVPLSTALYGSVALLIYRIAGICYTAFARSLLEVESSLRVLYSAVFILVLVGLNLAMIAAITQIPRLARSFLNLSLEEIVSFAESTVTKVWGLGLGLLTAGAAAGSLLNAVVSSKNGATAAGAAAGGAAAGGIAGRTTANNGDGSGGGGNAPGSSGIGAGGTNSTIGDMGRNAAMAAGAMGSVKASLDKGAEVSTNTPKSVLSKSQSRSVNRAEIDNGPDGLLGGSSTSKTQSEGGGGSVRPGMFDDLFRKNPEQSSFDLKNNLEENAALNQGRVASQIPAVSPVQQDSVSPDNSKQGTLEDYAQKKESVLMKNRVREGYSKAKEKIASSASAVKDGLNKSVAGRTILAAGSTAASAVKKTGSFALAAGRIATSKGVLHGLTAVGHTAFHFARTKGDVEAAAHVFKSRANNYVDDYREGRHDASHNLIDGGWNYFGRLGNKFFGSSSPNEDLMKTKGNDKEEDPNE